MELKQLFQNDDTRAVSPVIGVILMVAITVILAAVIGAFVIGIGPDDDATPTAQITMSEDPDSDDSLLIEHGGGDTLALQDFVINIGGEPVNDGTTLEDGDMADQDELSAGQSVTISEDIEDTTDGERNTVNLVHEPSNGIIADYDLELQIEE